MRNIVERADDDAKIFMHLERLRLHFDRNRNYSSTIWKWHQFSPTNEEIVHGENTMYSKTDRHTHAHILTYPLIRSIPRSVCVCEWVRMWVHTLNVRSERKIIIIINKKVQWMGRHTVFSLSLSRLPKQKHTIKLVYYNFKSMLSYRVAPLSSNDKQYGKITNHLSKLQCSWYRGAHSVDSTVFIFIV